MYRIFGTDNSTLAKGAYYEDLVNLMRCQRIVFATVFSILLAVSVGGNSAAIYTVIRRNTRLLQKFSLVSLAVSDLLMTLAYFVTNMEVFTHEIVCWSLGSFLCSWCPTMQVFSLTANLFSIEIIALDRYKNVVKALTQRWNPSAINCVWGFSILWIVSIGISWPVFSLFELKSLKVYESAPPHEFKGLFRLCVTPYKDELRHYYNCIAVFIFLTLLLAFLALNYSVARLIWAHRKPVAPVIHPGPEGCSAVTMETSYTVFRASSSQDTTQAHSRTVRNKMQPKQQQLASLQRDRSVQRKIRTFKIIVFCMFVFTICRLPFWIYTILKLSITNRENYNWVMLYTFNGVALVNCALDPFLYVYLNKTLAFLSKISSCLKRLVKACCMIEEFDHQHQRENPFWSKELKRIGDQSIFRRKY